MISDPTMIRAINEREERLASFYQMQRRAGSCPIEATELMGEYGKRLDAAEQCVADDKFNRDIAILRALMERSK